MDDLTFGPVEQLVDLLNAVEGVRATQNPADLTPPGVWVTVDAVNPLTVGGQLQLECSVWLVVGDADYRRAFTKLAELYNKVTTIGLVPDGPVVPQGLILPGTPSTPLPALRVPVNLI